uniref:Uncharacterized protein n=1 Tax=Cannabis sativa TaxID=3483 RepID=A0A803QRY3_CANSA
MLGLGSVPNLGPCRGRSRSSESRSQTPTYSGFVQATGLGQDPNLLSEYAVPLPVRVLVESWVQ